MSVLNSALRVMFDETLTDVRCDSRPGFENATLKLYIRIKEDYLRRFCWCAWDRGLVEKLNWAQSEFLADDLKWFDKISWYDSEFIFPSTMAIFSLPDASKQLKSIIEPKPRFIVGTRFFPAWPSPSSSTRGTDHSTQLIQVSCHLTT